jgi:hypothetical protein
MTVAMTARGPLNIGTAIADGDELLLYPTNDNTSTLRTGVVIIKDSFGNTRNINLIQAAPTVQPIVTISVNPYENPTGLRLIADASYGVAYAGSDNVALVFTVDEPTKFAGTTFTLYYQVVRNGVADAIGSFDIRDEVSNNKSILINSNAIVGEYINVHLSTQPYGSVATQVDANISAVSLPLVITLPTPTIVVSWLTLGNASLTWDAYTSGTTAEEISTVVLTGGTILTLRTFPSWITIIDKGLSLPITNNSSIDVLNGTATLGIYPTDNNGGVERTGTVVVEDEYGNSGVIAVDQTGSHDNPNVSVLKNPTDTSNLTIAGARGTSAISSQNITIIFVPNNPDLGFRALFTLQHQIWKNTTVVGMGDLLNVINGISNTRALTMSLPANVGDNITVYLNK